MSSNLLAAPVLVPPAQPVGGGASSSLAAALMGHNVPMSLPSLSGSVPLAGIEQLLLMQKLRDPSGEQQGLLSRLWGGLANLGQGYDWSGMAGPQMLSDLSQQAATTAANRGPY